MANYPYLMYNNLMILSSTAFKDNAKIPKIYSRFGGNRRPPLTIDDVPTNAKSLAIICFDPDAPFGNGFYHWVVWNIPPNTTDISNEYLPTDAVEGVTSWGKTGWGGPQPPFGTHRYKFTVYALDTVLDTPAATKPKKLYSIIAPHIIAQATLVGKFGALDIFDLR